MDGGRYRIVEIENTRQACIAFAKLNQVQALFNIGYLQVFHYTKFRSQRLLTWRIEANFLLQLLELAGKFYCDSRPFYLLLYYRPNKLNPLASTRLDRVCQANTAHRRRQEPWSTPATPPLDNYKFMYALPSETP